LEVVDLGTVTPSLNLPGVRHLNIGAGTPTSPRAGDDRGAGTRPAGRARQRAARPRDGAQLFIGGEMGIGNTTAASALACALLDCPAAT
jgi:nicotinate-nucleotide--dimethylbenzimidazole phosphoribosyltransferase